MHSYLFSPGASQGSNSIRIRAKGAMLGLITLLVVSLCPFPNLAAAATPHIYDAPNAGPPGSQTQTVGNGFDPNATLDIYLDSTDVGLVDTDNNGSFGMALKAPTIRQNGLTIHIPKDAVPGQHWITAVERITQLQAQVAFTVRADWPQFNFDAQHTGFNTYENVLSPATVGNLTWGWTYITEFFTAPVVANGMVYSSSLNDNVYALNADTGVQLWRYPTRMIQWTAPAVANGLIYFSSDDSFYALNASTGVLRWKLEQGFATTPAVANGVVYLGAGCNVYALEGTTGAILWTYKTQCIFGMDDGPAVANGVVYVSGTDSSLYTLDAATGAPLWKFTDANSNGFRSPVIANGIVYALSGYCDLYALDANTGAFLWKYPTGYGQNDSSPAVANGVVYIGATNGNLYALDAGTGVLLWTYTAGGGIGSSPAVANGVVYVTSQDTNVYALDADTGALLWKWPLFEGSFASSPAVVNGMLYVNSGDGGHLYAFGLPKQQMAEKFSPPERPDPARLTADWHPPLKK